MNRENLKFLPSIDRLLSEPSLAPAIAEHGREHVRNIARKVIEKARKAIAEGTGESALKSPEEWADVVKKAAGEFSRPRLSEIVNCSGVVVHTNLGRALLAEEAAKAAYMAAIHNVNLEYDVEEGTRGDRDDLVEELIIELTGAEAATVVNNNAAAVLLALNTLSFGGETIVSRGELIEIGGSFRLPEIMSKSGCALKEVGTTNRTHLADYEEAVSEKTALILRAHTSNYRIIGFTTQPSNVDIAKFAKPKNIPFMVDLGSGAFLDLSRFGLPHEPTARETLNEGADIVTISGDKLLGGPQAGIIAGKREFVSRIKKNHLKRALRCGKITLAALESTLRIYLNPEAAIKNIPTLRYLTRSVDEIRAVAAKAKERLEKYFGGAAEIYLLDDICHAGSGALPEMDIPSVSVAIRHKEMGPNELAAWFRRLSPPVIGRVGDDVFRLDMRCVENADSVIPENLTF